MSKGIVYILTNPCLDGWVKIGMTERNDISKRLNELNSPPNIPLMFRAYALYYVDNPKEVEKDIHELIDMIDDSLHAREALSSGKIREREFFKISPEKAFMIFKKVSKLRNDSSALELVTATKAQLQEEALSKRKKPFSFEMLNIPIGATLEFIRDDSIICTVTDTKNHVDFQGKTTTTSALTSELMGGGSYAGSDYFTYHGESLSDRRKRLELENSDEINAQEDA